MSCGKLGEDRNVDNPVSGRECGGCTACCTVLKVDEPELKKPSDQVCPNCTQGGCKIYETRPAICRRFECGWKILRYLGEEWRPDRCGVIIDLVEGDQIPAGFRQAALKFEIVDSPNVLFWPPLIRFIRSEIERGHPVFLGTPAAVGYERRMVFLNYIMAEAVAARDNTLMIHALRQALQIGLSDAMKEKATFS